MPNWYLWLTLTSLLYAGLSIILFRQFTARRINREIKESGEYYLSSDDKVGYTLLSIALAILLPKKWANITVPQAIINSNAVKKISISHLDIALSTSYIISTICLLLVIFYGTKFI